MSFRSSRQSASTSDDVEFLYEIVAPENLPPHLKPQGNAGGSVGGASGQGAAAPQGLNPAPVANPPAPETETIIMEEFLIAIEPLTDEDKQEWAAGLGTFIEDEFDSMYNVLQDDEQVTKKEGEVLEKLLHFFYEAFQYYYSGKRDGIFTEAAAFLDSLSRAKLEHLSKVIEKSWVFRGNNGMSGEDAIHQCYFVWHSVIYRMTN